MPSVLVETQRGVATLTLNRPEVRNAFDEGMIADLTAAFKDLSRDASLRAVVVRGAGKDFCAGADVAWMRRAAAYPPARNRKDAGRLVSMIRGVEECPVPVLARVHGNCYGGGLGIVAAADIAVASEDCAMAFSECRLGILPAVISSFVLPKIGPGQARRFFLTAESFGPARALAMGLVHEVAPEPDLDARIGSLLRSILRAAPGAVREAKALIRKAAGMPREARIRLSIATLARVRAGAEAREGLSAFLDKRPAPWADAPSSPAG